LQNVQANGDGGCQLNDFHACSPKIISIRRLSPSTCSCHQKNLANMLPLIPWIYW
jgi:hypothetical protein